jgi:hypothetical protein
MLVRMQDVRYRKTECDSRQHRLHRGSQTHGGREGGKNIHPDDTPTIHKWPPLVARPVSRLVQQRE